MFFYFVQNGRYSIQGISPKYKYDPQYVKDCDNLMEIKEFDREVINSTNFVVGNLHGNGFEYDLIEYHDAYPFEYSKMYQNYVKIDVSDSWYDEVYSRNSRALKSIKRMDELYHITYLVEVVYAYLESPDTDVYTPNTILLFFSKEHQFIGAVELWSLYPATSITFSDFMPK